MNRWRHLYGKMDRGGASKAAGVPGGSTPENLLLFLTPSLLTARRIVWQTRSLSYRLVFSPGNNNNKKRATMKQGRVHDTI